MMVVVFIAEQMAASAAGQMSENPVATFIKQLIWKDQFLIGFSFGQLIFLIMAWVIGAGTIANDNRANALLVYLSKPCSKAEYVFGKWLGIFLPLLILEGIPVVFFYLYGALSWSDYGFLKSDPMLLPKMLVLVPMSAALHASLVMGISSMFNQGRLAGAAYAGLYFLTNFVAKAFGVVYTQMFRHDHNVSPMVHNLFYGSVDGIQIALAKLVLGTHGSTPFGVTEPHAVIVRMPNSWWPLLVWAGLCALGIGIAWRRVRAVEVIG